MRPVQGPDCHALAWTVAAAWVGSGRTVPYTAHMCAIYANVPPLLSAL